jgi:hypothetical protein
MQYSPFIQISNIQSENDTDGERGSRKDLSFKGEDGRLKPVRLRAGRRATRTRT